MYFNKEIETLPLDKLRKLQEERLQKLVLYVYNRVPFYRKTFDNKGIKPSSIRRMEDLRTIPFTHKQDLRNHYPFGLFAVPEKEVIRLHASSGTTGKPTVVGYTRNDIEIFSEVVARSLALSGCEPGMKLQNAYGYGLFTGGLGLHYGAEKLGMNVIPVSGGMTERQILLLRDFKPEAICCTPSYAQTLSAEFHDRGFSPEDLNLKFAILGAEPWTEVIRNEVEVGLGVRATNIYGLSEIIGPGVSCESVEERGTGSYIWEDHFFPEVVDKDTGEPVPEGELGVLVFTTLTKEAMPLLRYWTNDITDICYTHSKSRTHIKMGPIRGRADDMLIIRGVNLFHTQIEELLKDIEEVAPHYQLVVSKSGLLDEVEVKVEISEPAMQNWELRPWDKEPPEHDQLKLLSGMLGKKVKDSTGLNMRITLCAPNYLPRSAGGKLSRIVDLRK